MTKKEKHYDDKLKRKREEAMILLDPGVIALVDFIEEEKERNRKITLTAKEATAKLIEMRSEGYEEPEPKPRRVFTIDDVWRPKAGMRQKDWGRYQEIKLNIINGLRVGEDDFKFVLNIDQRSNSITSSINGRVHHTGTAKHGRHVVGGGFSCKR